MRGGYGSTDHGTLADRSGTRSLAGTPDGGAASPAGPAASTPANPARHCFVDGSPALLVEWRQGPSGWEGRTLSMAWLADTWVTVERWLPATRIAGR